jgi:hypothetical protein
MRPLASQRAATRNGCMTQDASGEERRPCDTQGSAERAVRLVRGVLDEDAGGDHGPQLRAPSPGRSLSDARQSKPF